MQLKHCQLVVFLLLQIKLFYDVVFIARSLIDTFVEVSSFLRNCLISVNIYRKAIPFIEMINRS